MNIILIGMPGAGKSTVGPVLAQKLKMDYVDVDTQIAPTKRDLQTLVDIMGPDGFMQLEEKTLLTLPLSGTPKIIATGGSAVFSHKAMKRFSENGVLVYLYLPLYLLEKRVNFEEGGLVKQPGQTLQDVYAQRESLYQRYMDLMVETSGMSVEEVADAVMEKYRGLGKRV